MRLFIDKYNHYVAIDWLDMELKKVIGLDVYAEPFDQQSGFRVYNAGRFRVLLFRSDLDRNRQGDLVSDFLGKRVAIGDINVGAEKPYASEYRAFLEQIRPPEEYVDWMLDSRYAQHFWPPSTLDCLKKFWLRRVVSEIHKLIFVEEPNCVGTSRSPFCGASSGDGAVRRIIA